VRTARRNRSGHSVREDSEHGATPPSARAVGFSNCPVAVVGFAGEDEVLIGNGGVEALRNRAHFADQ